MEDILNSLRQGNVKRDQDRTCVVPSMPGGHKKDSQGRLISSSPSVLLKKSEKMLVPQQADPVLAVTAAFREQRDTLQGRIDSWLKDIKLAELESNRLKLLKTSLERAIDEVQEAAKIPEEEQTPTQKSVLVRGEQAKAKLSELLDTRIPANNEKVISLAQKVEEALDQLEKLEAEEIEAIKWNRFGANLTVVTPELTLPSLAPNNLFAEMPTSKAYIFDGCEIPGKGALEKPKDVDSLQAELCRNLKHPSLIETSIISGIVIDLYSYVWNIKDEVIKKK